MHARRGASGVAGERHKRNGRAHLNAPIAYCPSVPGGLKLARLFLLAAVKCASAACGCQLHGAIIALNLTFDSTLDRGEEKSLAEVAREVAIFIMTIL